MGEPPEFAEGEAAGVYSGGAGELPDELPNIDRASAIAWSRSASIFVESVSDSTRLTARAAKNWPEADRIRDALVALNVEVMDGPTGATWRIKEQA